MAPTSPSMGQVVRRELPGRRRSRLAAGRSWRLVVLGVLVGAVGSALLVMPLAGVGYDTAYALTWGQRLADGEGLDFSQVSSATPHPLSVGLAALIGDLPTAALLLLARGAAALGWVVVVAATGATTALTVGGFTSSPSVKVAAGACATVGMASCPAFGVLLLDGSQDLWFTALVMTGVACLLLHRPALSVSGFLLAGLSRPEGVLLAVVPVAFAALPHTGRALPAGRWRQRVAAAPSRLWVIGGPAVAAAWVGVGALGGEPWAAFTSATSNASLNDDPRGLVTALQVLPGYAVLAIGPALAIMGCAAAVWLTWQAAAARRPSRHPQPTPLAARGAIAVVAVLALDVIVFIGSGLLGTPLTSRYLTLAYACLVVLAFTGAVLLGRQAVPFIVAGLGRSPRHPSGPAGVRPLIRPVPSLVVLLALVSVSTSWSMSSQAGWSDVHAARHLRQDVMPQAAELLHDAGSARCSTNRVTSPALVPFLALHLDRPTASFTVDHSLPSPSAGSPASTARTIASPESTVATAGPAGLHLQPRTRAAATLAGYGPNPAPDVRPVITQSDNLEHQSEWTSEHWAVVGRCP